MNVEMWSNASDAAQRRASQTRWHPSIWPAVGEQACGEVGMGRMLEPEQILAELEAAFQRKHSQANACSSPLAHLRTDRPVRGITNLLGENGLRDSASGLGSWCQGELSLRPTALDAPYGVQRQQVQTAQQMHDAVMAQVEQQDIFIAVAAVADWRVANASDQKIKKTSDSDTPQLQFHQNPDILASVAALPQRPIA